MRVNAVDLTFLLHFTEKILLDVSCEPFANMTYHILFSLKNIDKKNRMFCLEL